MSIAVKKSFLLACAILVASLPMSSGFKSTSALSETVLDEYAQNNILFYDPDENCDPDSPNTTYCTLPSGNDITWIGDSYSVESLDKIKSTFSGVDLGAEDSGNSYSPYHNIQYSKHLDWISNSNTNDASGGPSGVKILEEIVNNDNLRPYLVLALGTNDTVDEATTTSTLENIANKVGSNTKVILTTAYTKDGNDYRGGNNAKKTFASSHDNFYVADWAAVAKPEYYADDSTHPSSNGGYDAWVNLIKETLPKNCSAGLLSGNSVAEKIWNYFVQAGIDGVSDNSAAISGIMGNLYTESGLNPFMTGSEGSYYRGLFMLNSDNGSDLWSAIDSAVGSNYWSFYGWWPGVNDCPDGDACADNALLSHNVPQDAIDKAIKMELDYLVLGEINGAKANDQTFHTEFMDFIDHFSVITEKNNPRSYAELFLITVEIAYETSTVPGEAPQDSGVRALGIERGHERWQGAKSRGDNATTIQERYAGTTTPTTTASSGSMTSGGSSVAAASSGGYKKYDDLTDAELWDLAELGILENGGTLTAFKNTLSITANLFEKNGSGDNGHSLWLYVRDGGWFNASNAAKMNGSHDISVDSKYIDAAREVLMTGNRTLPTQILEFDCVGDLDWVELDGQKHTASNPGGCGGTGLNEEQYYVSGKTKIHNVYGAEYIFYGWMSGEFGTGDPMGYFADNPPTDTVMTDSGNNGNDYCPSDNKNKTSIAGGTQIAKAAISMAWPVQADQNDDAHVGQCKDSDGSWKPYSTASYPNTCATNPRDLYRQQLDTWLPGDDGMDCGKFVTTVLRYTKTADTKNNSQLEAYFETDSNWEKLSDPSTSNLKPGDVFFQPGHVAIYIGDYGGTYGPIASASLGERVGQVTPYYNESSTTSAWRYKGSVGEGLTQEQAEKLADNYNNNVGNWDGKVAVEANYCQDANCASRYSNCVLFSAFFVEMFTDAGFGNGYPGGPDVVGKLKEMGFKTGTEPKPYSVFSTTGFHGSYHTGVVVAVDGDQIATVEAGYPSWPAAYHDFEDPGSVWIEYAYLDDRMDYSKLMDYINQ